MQPTISLRTGAKKALFRLGACLLGLAVSFLIPELAYRTYKVVRFGMVDYPDTVSLGIHQFDPAYGTVPTPTFRYSNIPDRIRYSERVTGYEADVSINRWGYRGRDFDFDKPAGVFRVVILGESSIMNNEVADDDTWSARLENKLTNDPAFLEKHGAASVEVINGGVSGWRTREGLIRFQRDVVRMEADLVLLAFNWNDFEQGVWGRNPDQPAASARPWWWYSTVLQNLQVRWLNLQAKNASTQEDFIDLLRSDQYYVRVFKRNLTQMSQLAMQTGSELMFVNLPGLCRMKSLDSREYSLIVANTRVTAASFMFHVRVKEFVTAILNEGIDGREVIDLTRYFDQFDNEHRLSLFVTEKHTNEAGSEEIARGIHNHLTGVSERTDSVPAPGLHDDAVTASAERCDLCGDLQGTARTRVMLDRLVADIRAAGESPR